MKLYDSRGPNPKAVRIYAAEVGVVLERVPVDMVEGENRREAFLKINPMGQLPVLETDEGLVVTEVVAICEYLDEVSAGPSLIGATAEERAVTRMWTRRLDLAILQPMSNGFRFGEGLDFFKNRIRTLPEAAEGLKATARDWLAWLDREMTGPWVCGDRFTLADVMLFANVDFFRKVGQPMDPEWKALAAWHAAVAARPSASA